MTNSIPLDTQYLLYKTQEHLIDYYQLLYEDFSKLEEVAKLRDKDGFYSDASKDFRKVINDLEDVKKSLQKIMDSKEINELIQEYLDSDDD